MTGFNVCPCTGGALFIYNGTDIYIEQSTFSNNNATNGGAIYLEVWPPQHICRNFICSFCTLSVTSQTTLSNRSRTLSSPSPYQFRIRLALCIP
jgi:hypothetical protein